jgi:hypothetical protein
MTAAAAAAAQLALFCAVSCQMGPGVGGLARTKSKAALALVVLPAWGWPAWHRGCASWAAAAAAADW